MGKLIFEKLLSLLNDWKTKQGFFVICLLIILIFIWVIQQFHHFQIVIIITCCVFVLWTIVWYICSGRFIFPVYPRKLVVLSINVDHEGQKNYRRILKQIKCSIDDIGLDDKIKIKMLAPDVLTNEKKAHKFQKRFNVDLIIWGSASYGNLNSEKVLKFDLFHTFAITQSLTQKLDLFLADILLMLQKKDWIIKELNELKEFKTISENLFESILFIIGLYLYDGKKFLDSIKIFESIIPGIIAKEKMNLYVEHHIQASRIRAILIELYYLQGMQYHEDGKVEEALTTLKKIPEHIPNKIPLYIMLARVYYLNGDISSAEVYTEKIRKINKKHPAVCLNYAFFGIRVKNYDRALFWYNMFLKNENLIDIDIYSVISFLETEYDKNQSELAFLYALGIVNGYIDSKKRKSDFRKFISKAKNRPEYKLLIQRAQELLNNN